MCVELKYKNSAIIPPPQSRVALAENLQNRQNSVVFLAPRYIVYCGRAPRRLLYSADFGGPSIVLHMTAKWIYILGFCT
jgi:hypothetical protein